MVVAIALQICSAQTAAVENIHGIDTAAQTAQPGLENQRTQQSGQLIELIAPNTEIAVGLSGVGFQRTELCPGLDPAPWTIIACEIADHLPFFPVPHCTGGPRTASVKLPVCPAGHIESRSPGRVRWAVSPRRRDVRHQCRGTAGRNAATLRARIAPDHNPVP